MYKIKLTNNTALVLADILRVIPATEFQTLKDLGLVRHSVDDISAQCSEIISARKVFFNKIEKARKPFLEKEKEILSKITDKSTEKEKAEINVEHIEFFKKVNEILSKKFEKEKKEMDILENKPIIIILSDSKFELSDKVFNTCAHKIQFQKDGRNILLPEKELLFIQDAFINTKKEE